jgi:hypothetical protein
MEKQKKSIDDFFRETLKTHEIVPSERTKEAFLKESALIPQKRRYRGGIILYFVLAILFIMSSIILYYSFNESRDDKPAGIINTPKILTTAEKTNLFHQKNPTVGNTKEYINQIYPGKRNQTILAANNSYGNPGSQNGNEFHSGGSQSMLISPDNEKSFSGKQDEKSLDENLLPITNDKNLQIDSTVYKESADTSFHLSSSHPDSIVNPPFSGDLEKGKKQRLNKYGFFSGTVQYTPEWMFNTLEEEKFVNTLGIEGIFTIGNYSVRTGLGLSITKGTNELVVEYNDFLGSYNKLDSMHFSWNGAIQDYIPSYYMSNQDVWDSLMKLDYPKVVKRYSYLQIPLILGYDFFHNGKFSLGFRTGPLVSILIYSKQLSEDYDPGKKKVIQINNITPEQVSLNWQFMGGINASVKLSENLRFEIEPMAKYYFNSVYEKSEITQKPWSVGVRAALIIKF